MLLADHLPAAALPAPFPLLTAAGMLDPACADRLRADFPRYRGAGFFPYEDRDCGPAVNALVAELTAPAFADAIGERLGVERLSQYPPLVTLCRSLNLRHGNIHTDSQSKIVTALVYLNEEWPHGAAGSLRFLANLADIEDQVAPQVLPVYGNVVAFRRADNSFHGHLPFEGDRFTIQIAWLADVAAHARKTRRGRTSRVIKKLLGGLDRWWKPRAA
ncbi:hypothetical protein J2X04_002593 [Lysobacter niabensis]|uniref:Prolyl 4-hydroxylase alpha subunit Fe(2+) 2OG dioxygenase domain-containing protein n=1 Tax=Agrilutibacter niabensis TaxID=380628 RepID=A0ABU1VRV5_9GAMM|nr:2OG-Fe(II) oxygenase [Lysobacter niabensis]MDR7100212.1 hypothetical protein [Lysobacter niabensis]